MPKLNDREGSPSNPSGDDEEAQEAPQPEVPPPTPPARINSFEISNGPDPSTEQSGDGGCWLAFKRDVLVAWDLTDEMLFHWLGVGSFRKLPLSLQREHWFVKWNLGYWFIWFGTIVSLFLGEKWHGLFGQVGKVSDDETRVEFEARVHWLYTTSGGMMCNLAKAVCSLLYCLIFWNHSKPNYFTHSVLPQLATCVMALAFALGNVCFVKVMQKKSRSGVRSIIVCNIVFSLGLFICFVVSCVEGGSLSSGEAEPWDEEGIDPWSLCQIVVKFMASICCIFFYVLATLLYSRLWSLYPARASNLGEKVLEAAPSIVAAALMVTLVIVGFHSKESRQFIYSSFM